MNSPPRLLKQIQKVVTSPVLTRQRANARLDPNIEADSARLKRPLSSPLNSTLDSGHSSLADACSPSRFRLNGSTGSISSIDHDESNISEDSTHHSDEELGTDAADASGKNMGKDHSAKNAEIVAYIARNRSPRIWGAFLEGEIAIATGEGDGKHRYTLTEVKSAVASQDLATSEERLEKKALLDAEKILKAAVDKRNLERKAAMSNEFVDGKKQRLGDDRASTLKFL